MRQKDKVELMLGFGWSGYVCVCVCASMWARCSTRSKSWNGEINSKLCDDGKKQKNKRQPASVAQNAPTYTASTRIASSEDDGFKVNQISLSFIRFIWLRTSSCRFVLIRYSRFSFSFLFFPPCVTLRKSDCLGIRVCIRHPIHRHIVTGYRVRMMNMNTNANCV